MPKSLVPRLALSVSATVLSTMPLGGHALADRPDQSDRAQTHGRDVYVLAGASLVNPTAETDPDEVLYNVAGLSLEWAPEDPLTWGKWSAATGTSRAAVIGGPDGPRTDVRISLRGLIPGGTYSIFWATLFPDSASPLCPTVERTLPLDAFKADRDAPDLNSFIAGPSGEAEFHGRVTGDLLAAEQVFYSVVYHADGQTYYPLPNRGLFLTHDSNCRSSYGLDALRQLLIWQKH